MIRTMDNRVYLAGCQNYEKKNIENAVKRALSAFDFPSSFDMKGKKILIKANLLSANNPDKAVTTHPEVVSAIAREFIKAGGEVTIADSPGGIYNQGILGHVYSSCGMNTVAEESGAKLNFDMSHRKVKFSQGKFAKEFNIISPVLDADFIISVAKLKTHGLAYYTGAVKNLFGAIPGLEKAGFHSLYPNKYKFNGVLVDLCEYIKPGISFVDGVIGMEGAGPSGGNAKHVGVIGASLNPYALDLAMSDLVSLPQSKIPILTEAAVQGLVPENVGKLEFLGDDPRQFKTTFQPAIKGTRRGNPIVFLITRYLLPKKWKEGLSNKFTPWPKIVDKCIACGKCVEICPRQVIEIENKKAKPDYSGCIRCYCCHEVCPVQAIELVKRSKL